MATKKTDFSEVLKKCEAVVEAMGLVINYTHNLDPFFKGDLDGKNIYIGNHLSPEEKVFNLLHLAGHSVQWNIDELLRKMGSELYRNPDDVLLKKLQEYEWQANCYALSVLHKARVFNLDRWLSQKYIIDMLYLTHFYKTGEKLKKITAVAKAYPFKRELESKPVPPFTPVAGTHTRNGLVISF
jgi:Zn-dependent peptidase ImmA (M78 family)